LPGDSIIDEELHGAPERAELYRSQEHDELPDGARVDEPEVRDVDGDIPEPQAKHLAGDLLEIGSEPVCGE
jgi:hypothetical protein